jgi:hypothetical protein
MNKRSNFKFWCQKVLPLVYDDSLSYYELLCKVVSYVNNLNETTNGLIDEINALNKYVESESKETVEKVVKEVVNEMLADGTINNIINNELKDLLNGRLAVKNRKFFFIGDSYSFGYTPGAPEEVGWMKNVANVLGLVSGVNYFSIDYAKIPGGYGMSPTVTGVHASWADLVRVKDFTNIPVNEITDVVILGGTNDYNYIDSIGSGMIDLNNVLKSKFPNANIMCGVYAWCDLETFTDKTQKVYNEYAKCIYYGWKFLPNSVWTLHKHSYLSSDNVHPTQLAYKESSYYLANMIAYGDCDVIYKSVHHLSNRFSTNIEVLNECDLLFEFKNGFTTVTQLNGGSSGIDNILNIKTSVNGYHTLSPIPDFICTNDQTDAFPYIVLGSAIYFPYSNLRFGTLILRDRGVTLGARNDQTGDANYVFQIAGVTLNNWYC